MHPLGFEPTISADERPQTYALDRAASGIGFFFYNRQNTWHIGTGWKANNRQYTPMVYMHGMNIIL